MVFLQQIVDVYDSQCQKDQQENFVEVLVKVQYDGGKDCVQNVKGECVVVGDVVQVGYGVFFGGFGGGVVLFCFLDLCIV